MGHTLSRGKKHEGLRPGFSRIVTRFSGIAEGLILFTPLVMAMAIFGYQIFLWARHGKWLPVSLEKFFIYLGLPPASFFSPKNWIGLAKAVQLLFNLPAALVFLIVSFVLAAALNLFRSRQ